MPLLPLRCNALRAQPPAGHWPSSSKAAAADSESGSCVPVAMATKDKMKSPRDAELAGSAISERRRGP
eukprot:CAMPEP_0180491650 /NCGR_PEP_ID=MMETSP1036_2-20121128/39761_1 /TAXON_ID=632150 /ORGANISM="Azadinium spinosum, Strain 3D9" /LENGTH=67 /DNA_ID=CAMNT_0022499923 /DNA_START=933 /DNA_END=1133 /DNA_ORIENTATION=-